MARKEVAVEPAAEPSAHAVTLVFAQRENGELVLVKRVPREEAVAYAQEHGAILVAAEQYLPHLT